MRTRIEMQEEEANLFAVALLMPEFMLQRSVAEALRNREPKRSQLFVIDDGEVVRDLAKRYQVSREMMTVRLVDLDLLGWTGRR